MKAARVLETAGCDAFVASDPFTVDLADGVRGGRDLRARIRSPHRRSRSSAPTAPSSPS